MRFAASAGTTQRDELGADLLDLHDRVALDVASEAVVPPRHVTDLELGIRLGRAGASPCPGDEDSGRERPARPAGYPATTLERGKRAATGQARGGVGVEGGGG